MLTRRIIPCLDIRGGRVVKGVQFENLRDMGDPLEHATYYARAGADELVFLDITATNERRQTVLPLVEKLSQSLDIPFTVGGGIRTVEDIRELLRHGADKVSLNSAAVQTPELITAGAEIFGSQCIVIAVDVKLVAKDKWHVFIHSGKTDTGLDALEWVRRVEELGAGEILLTSMDDDGRQQGFAVEITRRVANAVTIPVIASGGAGKKEHFAEVFKSANADAALAASLFHSRQMVINELKTYLKDQNIEIRSYYAG